MLNILQFFAYSHLPPHLQTISKMFHDLAHDLMNLPDNEERHMMLRKLLEAKDCAVRSVVYNPLAAIERAIDEAACRNDRP